MKTWGWQVRPHTLLAWAAHACCVFRVTRAFRAGDMTAPPFINFKNGEEEI